jgi:hypothetical protein
MNYLSTSTLIAELTLLFKVILLLSSNLLRKKESYVACKPIVSHHYSSFINQGYMLFSHISMHHK